MNKQSGKSFKKYLSMLIAVAMVLAAVPMANITTVSAAMSAPIATSFFADFEGYTPGTPFTGGAGWGTITENADYGGSITVASDASGKHLRMRHKYQNGTPDGKNTCLAATSANNLDGRFVTSYRFKPDVKNAGVLSLQFRLLSGDGVTIRLTKVEGNTITYLPDMYDAASAVPAEQTAKSDNNISSGQWYTVELFCDIPNGKIVIYLDGEKKDEITDLRERLGGRFAGCSFASGIIRHHMSVNKVLNDEVIFYIDDFSVSGLPTEGKILNDLKKTSGGVHPRIMMDQDRLTLIIDGFQNTIEPYYTWANKARNDANTAKTKPVVKYDATRETDGYDDPSAQLLARVFSLSIAYHIVKYDVIRNTYKEKLLEELDNAADPNKFPNWFENPDQSFLKTANMITAYAIAYDWLYHNWTVAERTRIRNALVTRGLEIAQAAYANQAPWTQWNHNWNIICNSGVGIGALAVADETGYESYAGLIKSGIDSMEYAFPTFSPDDGGWKEGPGYWAFMMDMMPMYLSSMKTALGTHYGIMDYEGIRKTGYYGIYMLTPNGWNNTQDCALNDQALSNFPELFFYGNYFKDEKLSAYRYMQIQQPKQSSTVKDLLWYTPPSAGSYETIFNQLDTTFRSDNSGDVVFRSGFFENSKNYLGISAGKNRFNHGQIDAGSFVYEAAGERWSVELGRENYSVPGYWRYDNNNNGGTRSRWDYYRCRAEGHNTFVVNPNRIPNAPADQELLNEIPIMSMDSNGTATIDMTNAYTNYVSNAERKFEFNKTSGDLIITDKITFNTPNGNDLYWFMHTDALIKLAADGKSAILNKNGKALKVSILDNTHTFGEMPAVPINGSPNPPEQSANAGVTKLFIHNNNAGGNNYLVKVSMKVIATDIIVNDTDSAADWSFRSNLQAGDTQYGDKDGTFVTVPNSVKGYAWIQTANDSRLYTTSPLAKFRVTQATDVYIAHNDLITPRPDWIVNGGWVDTNEDLVNSATTTYSLFKKTFDAGQMVTLGVNGATGRAFYSVILKPVATTLAPWDHDVTIKYNSENQGGTNALLTIKDDPTIANDRKAYIKFNVNSVQTVESAKLRIYGKNTSGPANVTIKVIGANGDNMWDENTLTWNMAESNYPPSSTGPLDTVIVNGTAQYYEFDVSDYVRKRKLTASLLTIIVYSDLNENQLVAFNSKDNAANPPQLLIYQ